MKHAILPPTRLPFVCLAFLNAENVNRQDKRLTLSNSILESRRQARHMYMSITFEHTVPALPRNRLGCNEVTGDGGVRIGYNLARH